LGIRKNVSQIVSELELARPQVSYHLRKLKDAGLAVEEKDGRWVWYQANWEADDRNLRDFIELMARWAGDAGGGGGGRKPRPQPVGKRPRVGEADGRPAVERPKQSDSEMDDFLL